MLVTSPEAVHPSRKAGSPSHTNGLTSNRSRSEQRNTLSGSYISSTDSEVCLSKISMRRQPLLGEVMLAGSVPVTFPLWELSPFKAVLTVTKELERWMKPAESVTIS